MNDPIRYAFDRLYDYSTGPHGYLDVDTPLPHLIELTIKQFRMTEPHIQLAGASITLDKQDALLLAKALINFAIDAPEE